MRRRRPLGSLVLGRDKRFKAAPPAGLEPGSPTTDRFQKPGAVIARERAGAVSMRTSHSTRGLLRIQFSYTKI
jgi:hypothetical protein